MGESPRQKAAETQSGDISGAKQRPSNAVLLMTTTALDTTWRVIVPGVVGVSIGLWLDKMWHTTPWMMIILLLAGVALSVFLVARLFKGAQR